MISFGLRHAKPEQRRVLRALARDLVHIGVRDLRVPISFTMRRARGESIAAWPWLGYYEAGKIYLNPKLGGNALYTIALHEIGHHLGLEHERSAASIMAAAPTVVDGRLSLSWRKSCLSSFLRAVTRDNLRKLKQ